MKQINGREFAKAIQRHGWQLVRVKASHHIFLKDGRRERIVIPIHGSDPLKIGLLRALMKIAELTDDQI